MPDHAVLVVVHVVLVEQRCHLDPVSPDRCQRLLHVVGAQVDGEHVAPLDRDSITYAVMTKFMVPVVGAVKIPEDGSIADPELIVQ